MPHRSFVPLFFGATISLSCVFAPAAHAQSSEEDRARAGALFEDAKALMAQGRFLEACPKLALARRIEPNAGGTLLALALCDEGAQRLATALAELRAAKRMAQGKNADRETLAGEHIDALVPHVSTITVRHSERATTIMIDGQAFAPSPEMRVEVDGGEHVIRAESPGKMAFEQRMSLATKDDARVVDLPELAREASPVTASSSGAETEPPGTRTLGFVVGGAGVVVTLVGGYFGLSALNAQSDSLAKCPSNPCNDQTAIARHADAQHAAIGADIGMGVGVAAIAAGALLILIDRGHASKAMVVAPTFGERRAGLGVLGRF